MKTNNSSALADKLFPDLKVEEIDILNIPAEERRLRTETYDFTVSTLIDYLKQGHDTSRLNTGRAMILILEV